MVTGTSLASNPPSTNTSATGGYLSPSSMDEYDKALDLIIQGAISGICNMPGWLVRRRWQDEPPNMPPREYNWCSYGVVRTYPDTFTHMQHNDGSTEAQLDELHEVLLSFYGPNASGNEATLRVGFQVTQNRQNIAAKGLEFVEQRGPTILPALLKQKHQRRVDATLVLRRRASFVFPILNVASAAFTIVADNGVPPNFTTVTQDAQPE